MQTRAVFFDLDETLLDDDRSFQIAVARVCEDIALIYPDVSRTALEAAYRSISDSFWSAGDGNVNRASNGSPDGQAIRLELWQQALASCGATDDSSAKQALDLYNHHRRSTYTLFSEVEDILEALHGHVALAVITNGPGDTQREKLRVTHLDHYFDVVAVSGEIGAAKPDPTIFRFALDKLGVESRRVLHVGDSLGNDIAGARNAGLTAVWLNRGTRLRNPNDTEPHHEISSLAGLLSLIDLDESPQRDAP